MADTQTEAPSGGGGLAAPRTRGDGERRSPGPGGGRFTPRPPPGPRAPTRFTSPPSTEVDLHRAHGPKEHGMSSTGLEGRGAVLPVDHGWSAV
ncbi:hypothetical protein [Streptomyces mirabilis]|uniref:hypothetical protein n=1 Tax=Streptomyces mirabilis TaxID=68239 RepID=UPI0033D4681B